MNKTFFCVICDILFQKACICVALWWIDRY